MDELSFTSHASRLTIAVQYPSRMHEPLAELPYVGVALVVELLHGVATPPKGEMDEAPCAERDGNVGDVAVHAIGEEKKIPCFGVQQVL